MAPSNDIDPPGSPYWTEDNLPGINDNAASVSDWVAGPAATFVSASQFTLVGDQTTLFTKSRRLKFTVTAGTVFGAISSISFGALTTVNVAFTSGALDSGLTAVSYSLVDPNAPSINADYANKLASSVASAGSGTTNIWGIAGNYVHVTGTNTIASFSSAPYAGVERDIIFDSALTLVHGGNLLVPGAVNVSTAANDRAKVRADTTSSAVITFYTKASGLPVGSFTKPTRQVFTTSSGTYTTPAAVTQLRIRLIGPGGGGGATATNAGANGSAATTFSTFSAGAGNGGGQAGGQGGTGGAASGGSINIPGGIGQGGASNAVAGNLPTGGNGAASAFGGAGGGQSNAAGLNAATNSGAGGGGAGGGSGNNSGGGGGSGGYVEAIINTPAATYSYLVGAGGAGGAAGTFAGGNGAAGIIIVDEFYN